MLYLLRQLNSHIIVLYQNQKSKHNFAEFRTIVFGLLVVSWSLKYNIRITLH